VSLGSGAPDYVAFLAKFGAKQLGEVNTRNTKVKHALARWATHPDTIPLHYGKKSALQSVAGSFRRAVDDMLNVSGHLMSTAQVESVLVEHNKVAESAVVPVPHPVKGEALYCFVTMNEGQAFNSKIETELRTMIREKIAPFASPDFIQSAPGLPKTRSGKIMRRVLKKIANDEKDLGDISTMADSTVVEVLFEKRREMMEAKKKK